jgi:opacity protein-like surface antigen
MAQDFYVSGMVGLNNQQDSSNSGQVRSGFTTPAVPGFTSMPVATGAPVSWNTDFSDGEAYSIAFGYNYKPFRVELALQRAQNQVDVHTGFTLANMDISRADVAILGSGSSGSSVEGFLAPGGQMQSTSVMLNAYYDFEWDGDIDPYVGLGIGNAEEKVGFASLNGNVVDGKENDFAWQLIAGFQYRVDDAVSFFGQYRFFQANDPEFNTTLFPGSLSIEHQFQAIEFGLRFSF